MAKLWLGKVRALFHFILSLRIDMKKRVYRNFDTPSFWCVRINQSQVDSDMDTSPTKLAGAVL